MSNQIIADRDREIERLEQRIAELESIQTAAAEFRDSDDDAEWGEGSVIFRIAKENDELRSSIAPLESRLADAEGVVEAANAVCFYDWSGNDHDAFMATERLRTRAGEWREGKSWQQTVGEWADATFPASSQETIIAHLRAEVNEEIRVDCDPSELADVGLLLLHLAHKRGVNLDALMRSKHEVNKRRKWQSTPNERGFMSHTEEADHAD